MSRTKDENSLSISLDTLNLHRTFTTPSDKHADIPQLHSLIAPHIDSFNSIFTENLLDLAVADIDPREITDAVGNTIKFWVEDVTFQKPMLSDSHSLSSASPTLLPVECRERGITYGSRLTGRICWMLNENEHVYSETRHFGTVPVMVRSVRCHLHSLSAKHLTAAKEEGEELGGYFIVNGVEKIIRLLVVTRRNYPIALKRASLATRGPLYTEFGIQIRAVRPDQTSQTLTLHYLEDGSIMLRFSYRKSEYLVPLVLVLKALSPTATDRCIFNGIVQHDSTDTFLTGRVEMMLRSFRSSCPTLLTQQDCLEYLGERFRAVFNNAPSASNTSIALRLIHAMFLVHLQDADDKFNMFILMARKLYSLVSSASLPDSADAPQHHEMLLSGHLYLSYLKERIDAMLSQIQQQAATEIRRQPGTFIFTQQTAFKRILQRAPTDIGKYMTYFLATGNLNTRTGMDLQQTTGYSVVAERLNFLRFISHFRSFHRGAFFTTMKNTDIRKLRPEQWGFSCPVHTPDGPSCGLLSHLTYSCQVSIQAHQQTDELLSLLVALGATPYVSAGGGNEKVKYPVLIDGKLVAMVSAEQIESIAEQLRILRSGKNSIANSSSVSYDLGETPTEVNSDRLNAFGNFSFSNTWEIAAIPVSYSGTFPGLFIFTTPSRLFRPVKHLLTSRIDYIGTLEQLHLNISIQPSDLVASHSHQELAPERMFSIVAGITPFSNYNQSPRNMYQCQMAKQTIGTPTHSHPHRTDSKMYRLHFGQAPLLRPRVFSQYSLDSYPNGTNAVVAVISYTGYDMEDAMILNKSACERGFGHACVYKGEWIDLEEKKRRGEKVSYVFEGETVQSSTSELSMDHSIGSTVIDMDGLPQPGTWVSPGDPLVRYVDTVTGNVKVERYKDFEPAIIDTVRLLTSTSSNDSSAASAPLPLQRIHIKFRVPRNPIIGDKFASRHGQKGVCSQRWPATDMPFSEHSGITPDIIINPHAFPSRMTIGMLLESMGAKAAALNGTAQDATSFPNVVSLSDYFGSQLLAHGFNYCGNEPLYSGCTGELLHADIYMGIVYYQRLRHMVSDKFQVRTTGPVHDLTRQPVKGRQRAGGIRFGEMERDALISHGAAYLLQDRLMNCSDYSQCYTCSHCSSILTPLRAFKSSRLHQSNSSAASSTMSCMGCGKSDGLQVVAVPFVLRYLATELMAMNVSVKISFK